MNTYSINCLDGRNVLIKLSDYPGDDAIADLLHVIHKEFGIEPEDALRCAVVHLTSVQRRASSLCCGSLDQRTACLPHPA
jgi:hypothetical protein